MAGQISSVDKNEFIKTLTTDMQAASVCDPYDWLESWLLRKRDEAESEWKAATATDAKTFWYNNKGDKTWIKPNGVKGLTWEKHERDGKTFWYNPKTKEKTWFDPNGPHQSLLITAEDYELLQHGWVTYRSSGKVWYYNKLTKKKQWHKPTVVSDHTGTSLALGILAAATVAVVAFRKSS